MLDQVRHPDRHTWKRRLGGLVLLGAVLVAVVGGLFFLVALTPCRLRLEPGSQVAYTITTARHAADADGVVHATPQEERTATVHLVCLGAANEVALVEPGGDGQREELTLLRFEEDGSARRMDSALRLLPDGRALGFFDFNLLPLPEGLDQSWRVNVLYAVPPPGQRQVPGRVRRMSNGLRPEFELSLDTIEWTDRRSGARWVQLKDLTCRYRYDTAQGIVDQASLSVMVGIEGADGIAYHQVRVQVQGRLVQAGGEGVAQLRDLALASAQAQEDLEQGRRERVAQQLARLLPLEANADGPLHALARRLMQDAGPDLVLPAPTGWSLQLFSVGRSREASARAIAEGLLADGYPARVVVGGDRVGVRLGPYRERAESLFATMRERFPQDQPLWVRE